MTAPKNLSLSRVSKSFTVTLFAIVGLVLGFVSLRFLDIVFYTTKPMAFLDQWHILLFIALLTVSFALTPAAASPGLLPLAVQLFIWVCVTLATGFLVSVLTATVHNRTLSIPAWLVPTGLLVIPLISGTVTVISARLWRRPHELSP